MYKNLIHEIKLTKWRSQIADSLSRKYKLLYYQTVLANANQSHRDSPIAILSFKKIKCHWDTGQGLQQVQVWYPKYQALFALSKVRHSVVYENPLGEQTDLPSKHALFLVVKCMQTSHDWLYTMFFNVHCPLMLAVKNIIRSNYLCFFIYIYISAHAISVYIYGPRPSCSKHH